MTATWFDGLSLRRKLMLMMTFTTVVVVVIAFGAFLAYDHFASKAQLAGNISSIADVVSAQSAASVANLDTRAALETLRTLRLHPNVVSASLFTSKGDLLADYWRDGATPHDVRPAADDARVVGDHAWVYKSVRRGGARVGTVVIEADLHDVESRRARYLPILGGLTIIAAIVTLLLSVILQRRITGQLASLAGAARNVSATRDYSVRVPARANDEIGSLTSAFNEMLGQIEERNEALRTTNDELQQRYEELRQQIDERQQVQRALAASEDTLRRMAFFDQLTGLPNRALFKERLDVALSESERSKSSVAVMFVDVDRFKLINDSLGHSAGDLLLREVASRITATLRRSDTLARLGGDEFTVLLSTLAEASDVVTVAEKILRAFTQPFHIVDHEWYATVSIGISVSPEDGTDSETLIKNADIAMYRAKDRGRDAFELYTPELHARAMHRVTVENDLRSALNRQEFVVHYQPVVSLRTGEIEGAEALVRWQRPDETLVPPGHFIPVAEETGLIVQIGNWVLQRACADARNWTIATGKPLRVSVNLAARQFQQANLAETVQEILAGTGLDAGQLELEITETSAMDNTQHTADMLRRLKQIGVRLSIDDFGTGYSSLGSLKRFPLDTLKVDRSFVQDVTTDARNAALIQAIVAIGRALNVAIVAEGVETEEQKLVLQTHGCDGFQGFLFSRAVPVEDFLRLVAVRPAQAVLQPPATAAM